MSKKCLTVTAGKGDSAAESEGYLAKTQLRRVDDRFSLVPRLLPLSFCRQR